MFKRLKNLFSKPQTKNLKAFDLSIWSVKDFNEWFCDPDNGATYAHKGIFGRSSKLGNNHITEFFEKFHQMEAPNELITWKLLNQINNNWKNLN